MRVFLSTRTIVLLGSACVLTALVVLLVLLFTLPRSGPLCGAAPTLEWGAAVQTLKCTGVRGHWTLDCDKVGSVVCAAWDGVTPLTVDGPTDFACYDPATKKASLCRSTCIGGRCQTEPGPSPPPPTPPAPPAPPPQPPSNTGRWVVVAVMGAGLVVVWLAVLVFRHKAAARNEVHRSSEPSFYETLFGLSTGGLLRDVKTVIGTEYCALCVHPTGTKIVVMYDHSYLDADLPRPTAQSRPVTDMIYHAREAASVLVLVPCFGASVDADGALRCHASVQSHVTLEGCRVYNNAAPRDRMVHLDDGPGSSVVDQVTVSNAHRRVVTVKSTPGTRCDLYLTDERADASMLGCAAGTHELYRELWDPKPYVQRNVQKLKEQTMEMSVCVANYWLSKIAKLHVANELVPLCEQLFSDPEIERLLQRHANGKTHVPDLPLLTHIVPSTLTLLFQIASECHRGWTVIYVPTPLPLPVVNVLCRQYECELRAQYPQNWFRPSHLKRSSYALELL
jgi:hypothetical protein